MNGGQFMNKKNKEKIFSLTSFISSCIVFYALDNFFGIYSKFNRTPLIYILIAGIIIALISLLIDVILKSLNG